MSLYERAIGCRGQKRTGCFQNEPLHTLTFVNITVLHCKDVFATATTHGSQESEETLKERNSRVTDFVCDPKLISEQANIDVAKALRV